MLWRCVGIAPLCHICLCPGPSHPAVIKSRACCDDTVLLYCSPQTSSTTLASRLVAGWRVLKRAISVLTNKLNNKYGKKRQLRFIFANKKSCHKHARNAANKTK